MPHEGLWKGYRFGPCQTPSCCTPIRYTTREMPAACTNEAASSRSCIEGRQPSDGGADSVSARPVILFVTHKTCIEPDDIWLYWMARDAGFRSIVTRPAYLHVKNGTARVCGGFEALPEYGTRRLLCGEPVVPDAIMNYWIDMSPCRESLFGRLSEAYPEARLSYHPELKFINTKWGSELCFLAGEKKGFRVRRPETYLVAKQDLARELGPLGKRHPLIFKPAEGYQGRGIRISTPDTFHSVVEDVVRADAPRFVVQRVVDNAVRFDGRRFDVRVYALVKSLDPLEYSIFRGGIVRLAAEPESATTRATAMSTLTNCDYRAREGRTVDNLTIPGLLDALASRGQPVEDFWSRVDYLAEQVFRCFAAWKPLAKTPDLSRYFLVTGLDIMLVDTGRGIEPILIESNYGSCAAKSFGPEAVDAGLKRTNSQWLEILSEVCAVRVKGSGPTERSEPPPTAEKTAVEASVSCASVSCCSTELWMRAKAGDRGEPLIRLPTIETISRWIEAADAVPIIRDNGHVAVTLSDSSLPVLGHVVGRRRLLQRLGAPCSNGDSVVARVNDDAFDGLELRISRDADIPVLDVSVDGAPGLDSLEHPLSPIFPALIDEDGTVHTKVWPGTRYEHRHPALRGPTMVNEAISRDDLLMELLGRVISTETETDEDRIGRRFVEPGVGRSVLVDLIRIEGRPDLKDFSVLGAGLTPYSRSGFILTGPDVDGLCSLKKAHHRRRIADRLESAGCRVPASAAIISLPGLEKTWNTGAREPAALLVRGFRTILRVQQLDPLHGFLHSDRHRPLVTAFLLGKHLGQTEGRGAAVRQESAAPSRSDWLVLQELRRYSCKRRCIRHLLSGGVNDDLAPSGARRIAMELRLQALRSYAPALLDLAKDRVALELGRDPEIEALDYDEYAHWFAERVGEQLAIMRKLRFLNDYRMARDDWDFNALSESQVSLLAEFIDLDTGIFLDTDDLDAVLLTKEQFRDLVGGFDEFHASDVEEAKAIVRTLALIACRENTMRADRAVDHFEDAYERGLAAHGLQPSG